MAFSPDGKTLAAGSSGVAGKNDDAWVLKLWDVDSGRERADRRTPAQRFELGDEALRNAHRPQATTRAGRPGPRIDRWRRASRATRTRADPWP